MGTQNERAVIDLVINGKQSEVSMKSLTAATINQRKALYSLSETDPGYKKQKKELEDLMRAQQARIVRINDEKTAWQKFTAGTASVAAGIVGGGLIESGFRAVTGSISSAITRYREFNAASKELSAVTGATGKDLAYLNETAAKTGPEVGKSGAEMLEAYKLMASAKPELLAQKELLTQTTEAAITLSQAGMIDLATSTTVTAESLNQFGEGADQANRFINVIAAGAKEGSAEINDMGAALKNSGTVAASQNVSFEQTNAVLQSMSTIALKGGEAGTGLRNFLLTLGSGADETNPKVVGLDKALENLAKKNLSTAELTKLFGKENVTAAQHIITHRNEIAELTKKVTGTQEAFTQAQKNNESLDHQLELFGARVDQVAAWLGGKLAPSLSEVVATGIELIQMLPQMGNWLAKNGEWLLITGIPALLAYNGAMIAATASAAANTIAEGYRRAAYQAGFAWLVISETATKAYALATGVLTGQISLQTAVVTIARNVWAVFNSVLLANPIGIVVGALAGLVGAMKYFSEHTERALDLERKKGALQKQGVKATQDSAKVLADLNEKVASANNLSAVEQSNLKKTIALKEMEARARLQNALAKAREIAREEAAPTFWQGVKSGATNLVTGNWSKLSGAGLEAERKQQTEANKAAAYAEAKRLGNVEQLQADLASLDKLGNQVGNKPGRSAAGGGGGGQSEEQKKAAKKAAAEAKHDADELEKMLADARADALKAEQSDYDKAVTAFAEKYSKMYELAGTNAEKLKEIETLSLVEMASIQQSFSKKKAEEQQKADVKRLKGVEELAEKELKLKRELALRDVQTSVSLGGISKEEGKVKELEIEQQFLLAKEMMYAEHYEAMANAAYGNDELMQQMAQDLATAMTSIDQAQFDKEGEMATARGELRKSDLEHASEVYDKKKEQAANELAFRKQMADEVYQMLSNDWTATLEGYKSFWKESSLIQKAALIAQKAWALAEIGINLARQISLITTAAAAMNAFLPGSGVPFEIKGIAKAIGTAALQSAAVVGVKAFADGGFTNSDQQPSGYTAGPTYFAKSNIIAGEKGQEWIMSAPMLRNPVMANLAQALQQMQVSGQYRNLSLGQPGSSGGSTGGGMSDQLLLQLIMETKANNAKMEQIAKRPIVYNQFRIREQTDYLDEIEQETSL